MTDYVPYSRRQQLVELQGQPVPLVFDALPKAFLNQVLMILDDIIGLVPPRVGISYIRTDAPVLPNPDRVWDTICRSIARETGEEALNRAWNGGRDLFGAYLRFSETPLTNQLAAIEFAFRTVKELGGFIRIYKKEYVVPLTPQQGGQELNQRFRQHYLGYHFDFTAGQINRLESEYLYAAAVDPGLTLLRQSAFAGAEAEFLQAQKKYRDGDYEGSIVEALKAFESTMQQICDARGWTYTPNANAKDLINVLLDHDLLPKPMESFLGSLRNLLESGLPTVRNKNAGHGRGSTSRNVSEHLAAFALHLAAANIVFLTGAHMALPLSKSV